MSLMFNLSKTKWNIVFCSLNPGSYMQSVTGTAADYYWLTPPSDFARNHYPQNNNWVLLPNYTKDNFSANPYYLPSEISNLKLIIPSSGIITAAKGDTIRFKINYTGYFTDLQINSNLFRNQDIWVWDNISKKKRVRRLDTLAVKKQQYIDHKWDGNVCEFEYFVTDNSLYFIDILFDRQRVMRFKIVTSK